MYGWLFGSGEGFCIDCTVFCRVLILCWRSVTDSVIWKIFCCMF